MAWIIFCCSQSRTNLKLEAIALADSFWCMKLPGLRSFSKRKSTVCADITLEVSLDIS